MAVRQSTSRATRRLISQDSHGVQGAHHAWKYDPPAPWELQFCEAFGKSPMDMGITTLLDARSYAKAAGKLQGKEITDRHFQSRWKELPEELQEQIGHDFPNGVWDQLEPEQRKALFEHRAFEHGYNNAVLDDLIRSKATLNQERRQRQRAAKKKRPKAKRSKIDDIGKGLLKAKATKHLKDGVDVRHLTSAVHKELVLQGTKISKPTLRNYLCDLGFVPKKKS